MRTPPTYVDAFAGAASSLLRRLAPFIEAVDGAIVWCVDQLVELFMMPPAAIVIAISALLVWRGRDLPGAISIVLSSHVIVFAGAWATALETLAMAVVAGAVGLVTATMTRRVRARLNASWMGKRLRLSQVQVLVVAFAIAAVSALAPFLVGSATPAWELMTLTLVVPLALAAVWTDGAGGRLPSAGILLCAGLAAALFTGLVADAGLGGYAARAAKTADSSLALQTLAATTGLVVATIVGTTRRDPGPVAAEPLEIERGGRR